MPEKLRYLYSQSRNRLYPLSPDYYVMLDGTDLYLANMHTEEQKHFLGSYSTLGNAKAAMHSVQYEINMSNNAVIYVDKD